MEPDTSVCTAIALAPHVAISSTRDSSSFKERAAATTLAPALDNANAVPLPMPLPAPVMTAVLPCILNRLLGLIELIG